MRFASLGSGSRGNATIVQHRQTTLMVDCGFSLKETERRLERLGISPSDIDAILVTHEHGDHASGVGRFSRRYQLPVYMTHGTQASGRCDDVAEFVCIRSEQQLAVGDIQVCPVAVPHDAREPCQFVFRTESESLGVLTDLGSLSALVLSYFGNCDALLLECNHDSHMLEVGPYPPALKRRVGGDWGHLSNAQAAQLLNSLDKLPERLVIAHISEKNNEQQAVLEALSACLESTDELVWAEQADGFDWIACK